MSPLRTDPDRRYRPTCRVLYLVSCMSPTNHHERPVISAKEASRKRLSCFPTRISSTVAGISGRTGVSARSHRPRDIRRGFDVRTNDGIGSGVLSFTITEFSEKRRENGVPSHDKETIAMSWAAWVRGGPRHMTRLPQVASNETTLGVPRRASRTNTRKSQNVQARHAELEERGRDR